MLKEKTFSVLLDTSFLIRLLSKNDPLHQNAEDYYRYFLEKEIPMYISTITVAEYCVNGDISELPLRSVRIIPFNIQHAPIAGGFANILYSARKTNDISVDNRLIIPNDVKLFAQAECTPDVKYFVTSDTKSSKLIDKISEKNVVSFEHMDIHEPYTLNFGILPMSLYIKSFPSFEE